MYGTPVKHITLWETSKPQKKKIYIFIPQVTVNILDLSKQTISTYLFVDYIL